MGRERSKHRRLIYSFHFIEFSLLDCHSIFFNCSSPSRLEISAGKFYKSVLLLGWTATWRSVLNRRTWWRLCYLTANILR